MSKLIKQYFNLNNIMFIIGITGIILIFYEHLYPNTINSLGNLLVILFLGYNLNNAFNNETEKYKQKISECCRELNKLHFNIKSSNDIPTKTIDELAKFIGNLMLWQYKNR